MGILRPGIVLLLLLTGLTGVIYPLAITAFAQLVMPRVADGNLVERDGRRVGSELIGQAFASGRYFWGRPSAAGKDGYDAAASSGSNLGPTSAALMQRIAEDVGRWRDSARTAVPADAITTSGSGLDPHISPATAVIQISRVAQARGLPEAQVRSLVAAHVEPPALGFIGEPRINVLALNLALDVLQRAP